MNRQQYDELYDEINAMHWDLWRVLSKVERGSHRIMLANADEALCTILREMQDIQPEQLTLIKEG